MEETKTKKGLIRLIIWLVNVALLIAAIVLFCCKSYLVCSILLFIRIAIDLGQFTYKFISNELKTE